MYRYGQMLETPLGVAAGPHTQLSQNIIAAWLCGARYMELKTVQTLDELDETITIKGKITWIKNAGEKSWEVGLKTKKMQFMQMQRLFDLAKKKKTKHY